MADANGMGLVKTVSAAIQKLPPTDLQKLSKRYGDSP